MGWLIAVIASVFLFLPSSSNDSKSNEVSPAASSQINVQSTNAANPQSVASEAEPKTNENSWKCVDATSYNQNAFDDNRCTNGAETRYVSDSQAKQLDPNYTPGKAGASYYNNQ